jgi:glycerol-3-phosphate dehydrogenase
MTMVGTTDEPFEDMPEKAVASQDELAYLVDAVQSILPQIGFQGTDVDFHYSGVRPLPYVDAKTPAAVTRRHWVERVESDVPTYCVIGGKLTTCRSLAEETVSIVLGELNQPVSTTSAERMIPGAEGYPADADLLQQEQARLAYHFGVSQETIEDVWRLLGTRTESVLASLLPDLQPLPDVNLPARLADWMIEHESARTLDDLVERRLMLLYDQRLSRRTLEALADALVRSGKLESNQRSSAVSRTTKRLAEHFGKRLAGEAVP